ncbi:hypothetical protein N9B73_06195 [Verrucomicrobiales bacterium]|nr:hypothetical protein [Verrucomicrobiales bacterium]
MKLIAPLSSLLLFSSPLLAAEPENLIDNPGFESGGVAWKLEKGRAEIVKGDALTGDHFVQMTDQSEEETHVYESRHYPARPGGEYTASVHVRTKDKGGQGIYLNFFNATGARLTSGNVRTKGPTTGWEKITITETAPEDAATVMVFLYSYLKDVGTYDFDEVSLTVQGGESSPGLSALNPTSFEPITIGSRRELLVDSHLVDGISGLRFALHHPRDEGIALQLDKPWEGKFAAYTTILTVGDTYRAYYRGRPDVGKDGDESESTCVAESKDGISWTRPSLGLHEMNGSKDNNIVLSKQSPYSHNFSPFVDSNPDADPKEKFKAIGGLHPEGLALFVSPDGYSWSLKKKKILTSEKFAFDSQACTFWSELEKKYVCFFRTWKNKVRWVSRATSDDCLNWSPHVEMKSDRPAEHFYTSQTHPYFRAPHLYVSLAARFIPKRQVITDEEAKAIGVNPKYFKDASDAVFVTSRGDDHFDRTFMSSFIRPGIGAQNWVSRTNYPALNVIQTSPKEMSIFLNQNYAQPTAHLRRYSLRLDGFGSIQADYDGGELLTKPLIFSGSKLSLNFSTSAAGGIRIELQEPDGKVIPGFSLYECRAQIGNEIERTVNWDSEGKLQDLAGKPIRLRMVMRDVDLFSLQFQK